PLSRAPAIVPYTTLFRSGRTQLEDSKVPHGQGRREAGEEHVAVTPAVRSEGAREQQEVQAERHEGQKLMDDHRAPRTPCTGSSPGRAARASRPRGSKR